jgi:hypothetical protein
MVEIAAEKNSTIVFPIPVELLEAFQAVGRLVPASGDGAARTGDGGR